ncbi:hypothetical protein EV196_11084 [Mariniflexile fucanivorans]|uniref:GIY-YIG domain-containing protein n=1 Tax=Mariniflexile fucanivorans TaxID=264023 RepID=A0A4R1RBG9_9FLAO|nr:GIY-YIG nuclease family protein [Mariniflexile fucanivorans]TCL63131.1 hypothetical protein EV196_11084 [Mariniflexile fucanivorans]
MKKLTEIGFKKVGKWSFENNLFQFELNANYTTKNILYSFVIEYEIKYIGKSVKTISQRLNGYRRPNISQRTNFRLNNLIIEKLRGGKEVEIYLFEDNAELNYKEKKINLSAGLEDNLIAEFLPEWNYLGKNGKLSKQKKIIEIENKEKIMEKAYKEEIIIQIGEAYYNQGFFNIGSKYSEFLPKNNLDPIKIQIEENEIIIGKVYKFSNSGQTRIKDPSGEYKRWVQRNFDKKEVFKVEIIEKDFIKLKK